MLHSCINFWHTYCRMSSLVTYIQSCLYALFCLMSSLAFMPCFVLCPVLYIMSLHLAWCPVWAYVLSGLMSRLGLCPVWAYVLSVLSLLSSHVPKAYRRMNICSLLFKTHIILWAICQHEWLPRHLSCPKKHLQQQTLESPSNNKLHMK